MNMTCRVQEVDDVLTVNTIECTLIEVFLLHSIEKYISPFPIFPFDLKDGVTIFGVNINMMGMIRSLR